MDQMSIQPIFARYTDPGSTHDQVPVVILAIPVLALIIIAIIFRRR
jgi:hypothetical protein